jgi:hypothetical protein
MRGSGWMHDRACVRAAAPRTRRHALPNDVSSDSHGYICNDERHDHGEAFRLRRSTQLSRHGFVSRALFGSRVRATEVISVKAYPGFDLVDNHHADFATLTPASPLSVRPRSEGVLKVRREKRLIRESSRWRPRWRVRFLPDGRRTPNRLRRAAGELQFCRTPLLMNGYTQRAMRAAYEQYADPDLNHLPSDKRSDV